VTGQGLHRDGGMLQGAVGIVRRVEVDGCAAVEKRMADPARHRTEVRALAALAGSGLPVPRILRDTPGSIIMTLIPGDRADRLDPDERLAALRASARLLRRLHDLTPPDGLAPAPDDESLERRYAEAGGPPLPLAVPAPSGRAFCHGDWADGNLLVEGGRITGVVDWEAAHVGDPMRDLSRFAWHASRKDARAFEAIVESYGADPATAAAWAPVHAAELWLWFREKGPPEFLDALTAELVRGRGVTSGPAAPAADQRRRGASADDGQPRANDGGRVSGMGRLEIDERD
jgi:aminoglycoside phosphotransferase (APT) family kinase protein